MSVIRRAPEHLRRNRDRLRLMRRRAREIARFYCVPVWLCGSALLDCNAKPRDWDIRLTLPDDDFARRYGDPEKWEREGSTGEWTDVRWRWSNDCVKRSKQESLALGLNIDLQIYPASHAIVYRYEPRYRLDVGAIR